MVRRIIVLILLVANATPALAWDQPPTMDDPLARRIACTAKHESAMLGPSDAQVSIFSVPEPDGSGSRLYVGLAEDLFDRGSAVHLWRGPLAAGWGKLGPVPEYTPRRSAPNPARYRIEREGRASDGRRFTELMEIDLSTRPAQLKPVSEPAGPVALEEITPLGDSMRMLSRLNVKKTYSAGPQVLASYEMVQGDADPPTKRPLEVHAWQAPMDSHVLLVCQKDNPDKSVAYFLPMRPFGWIVHRMWPESGLSNSRGSFALEMYADYLVPDTKGELVSRAARHRVTVGMGGMTVTTLETGYLYDVGSETWLKVGNPEPRKSQ